MKRILRRTWLNVESWKDNIRTPPANRPVPKLRASPDLWCPLGRATPIWRWRHGPYRFGIRSWWWMQCVSGRRTRAVQSTIGDFCRSPWHRIRRHHSENSKPNPKTHAWNENGRTDFRISSSIHHATDVWPQREVWHARSTMAVHGCKFRSIDSI